MPASDQSAERPASAPAALLNRLYRERRGLLWGALTNVGTTSLAFLLAPYSHLAHLMIIHLVGAVLISTRYGMLVSTFTAVTGALAFDYYCIPPIFAFALPDTQSVLIFAGMLGVALLVCWLNQGLREQRAAARASEARTHALCELSIDLSQASSVSELSSRAAHHLQALFGPATRLDLDPYAQARPHEQLQPVGLTPDLFGYIRVGRGEPMSENAALDRGLLLAACADRVAEALKRLALDEAARRAQVDAEMEHNRSALLSAVSHDMKTPLASILTAGTSLLSSEAAAPRDAGERELLETIVQEAERMNGLITNLLSVTRFESSSASINKEFEALDDLIFAVLSRLSGRLAGRAVKVDVPADLPMLELDPVLIDQLLVNLVENVLRYTPGDSPVEIRVRLKQETVALEVRDRGPGIAPAERQKIFDKFVRGQAARSNDGGTGLGLTICRAIARAHRGEVSARSRSGGGAILRLLLPLTRPAPPNRRASEPATRRAEA